MGYKTVVDQLQRHFTEMRPSQPVPEADLQRLVDLVPSVPESLITFLRSYNGLVVPIEDSDDGVLHSASEICMWYPLDLYKPRSVDLSVRMIPINGDGCGDFDCVLAGPGVGQGSVVYWDHEAPAGPSILKAGSLELYVELWAEDLMLRYLPDGTEHPDYVFPRDIQAKYGVGTPKKQSPWQSDLEWLKKRDPRVRELLASEDFMKVLGDYEVGA